MNKKDYKKDYQHYYVQSKPTTYPEGYKKVLIDSEEKFNKLLGLLSKVDKVALDLETTSLNPEEAEIVGVGVCFEEKRGFYLPFRHKVGQEFNLPVSLLDTLYTEVISKKEGLWYNYTYDGMVLHCNGYDIEDLSYYDVMNLVWLTDTNWKQVNLKWAENYFLGWEVLHFEDVLGGVQDFSYINPKDALLYVTTDVLGTFNLERLLRPVIEKESSFIVRLDNAVILPLIRGQAEDHIIDEQVLMQVAKDLDNDLPRLEKEIWDECNRVFDINSPEQLGDVLSSMGLDTGSKTTTGKMSTKADYLDRLDHPVAKKIVEFKKKLKWKSSFVNVFLKEARKGYPVRFRYITTSVPTGRFAAGKDSKNTYFAEVNIQAILKPKTEIKYAHYIGGDEGVLGWVFNDEESDRKVEVPILKLNVRHAIKAPEGWWFVRCDFAGQELRIPANVAKERVWIEAFNKGVDIHSAVCKEVFGEVNSENRSKTKVVNFCETANNYVKTELGYRRVCLLKEADKIKDVHGNVMKYKVEVIKDQPCQRLVFSNGIVSSFHESHKLKVWNSNRNEVEWKEVKLLQESDQILSKAERVEGELKFNSKAYLAGLYLGDGSRGSSRMINVCVPADYLLKGSDYLPTPYRIQESSSDKVVLFFYRDEIGEEWGAGKFKTIPDYVFSQWDYSQRVSLLAGLLDSDGSIYNKSLVRFQNTNFNLISKTALLCNLLGMKTLLVNLHQPGVTKDGVRSYRDKKGKMYRKVYTLCINDQGGVLIPLQVSYKWVCNEFKRSSPNIGFKVNSSFFDSYYKDRVSRRGYNKKDEVLMTLDNLRRGKCRLSRVAVERLKGIIDVGISQEYYPVTIKKRSFLTEDIYALEVDSHEYISSSLMSHNSILYGASHYSYAKKQNISEEEALKFFTKYKNKHKRLFSWIDAVQNAAARSGIVYTAFGRPRRLYHYFASADKRIRAFARRSAVNTFVQGSGADIFRIAFVNLYRKVFKPKKDIARFQIAVHDEIDWLCKKGSEYLLDEVSSIMTLTRKDWEVPMTVGLEIGTSWGDMVEFVKENDRWVPKKKSE